MASSPPDHYASGPPERNLANPLLHQRYTQQRRSDHPAQYFITAPSSSNIFAPVLPPNLATMPELPPPQFPGQQSSIPQNMSGPSQSHLPEEQALRQIISARAMQHQHQSVQLHHPNPLSQQQHLQFSLHHLQLNSLHPSQLPTIEPQVPFITSLPVNLGLQQVYPSPSNNLQNGASNLALNPSQYALRTYRDMHEQSAGDFVHGIRRTPSTSNPQIFHPQPHHSTHFAPRQPSGIFPPLSPSAMAGSSRKKPSKRTNATSSTENAKGDTSAQDQVGGGTVSQSMIATDSEDAAKAEQSPEINTSPLAHIKQRLARPYRTIPSNQRRNQVGKPRDTKSNGASQALQPSAAKSPLDATIAGINQDSGYTSRHEPLGKHVPAPDATAEILDAASASLEQQIQSATLAPFAGPQVQQFSDYQISHSIPFMKVTKSTDLSIVDNVSSLAGDPPFLEGEDLSDRPSYVSHPYNRNITWQQYGKYLNQYIYPFGHYTRWPPAFTDDLGFLKDTETLLKLPNGGNSSQYLSEPPQQPDTRIWVVQVTWLPKNGDLWLPVPLHQLLGMFDTPYGIAIEFPDSVKAIIRPNRHAEFTESEATTLMEISMERLRAAYSMQPQISWDLYTARFKREHSWTPTVERMRVLDLMFQVDLIFYWQGVGQPLHLFSIYNQNEQRKRAGLSPVTGFD